jgi:Signal transduction histidine kinase
MTSHTPDDKSTTIFLMTTNPLFMITRTLLLVFAILFIAGLFTGCIQNNEPETQAPQVTSPVTTNAVTTPSASSTTITTTPALIAFVDRAVQYARENGRENAIATFNDPDGIFSTGNLYIFAEDYNGTALAEPFEHEIAGTNILDITDTFGTPVVRNLGETARFGKGFVSYAYPNPHNNYMVEQKLSVVADVDGTYYVGAGFYASDGDIYPSVVLNTSGKQPDIGDLVAYVKSTVACARANGKEKSLAVFNDPHGPFVQGQLVVMAFDFNGTNLASPPYAPEVALNRINLINYHDPDGVDTIRGMRDLAKQGGGVFYTVAKVTVDGKEIYLPKIDYAEPVDDTWWLFSGIIDPEYTQAATGNLTGIPVRTHTRVELFKLVSDAVTFAQSNGKEKTLAVINDPEGQFVNGDLYVWAESADGTLLADPFWKSGIGQNYIDFTDIYGMETTRVGIDAMQNGTGFYHALFPNTAENGTAFVPKLIFMKPVDGNWWIGGGVYGIEVG